MKIVVLDGYALNPGDLSWARLERIGPTKIFQRTPTATEVINRAAGADIVLTNKVALAGSTISALPALRYIGVLATGYNVVDLITAKSRHIAVTNVPDYGTMAVAQMTIALMLELTNRVGHHAGGVAEGKWQRAADWCYWEHPLVELSGRNLGIIGYGRIGQTVAACARSLGMNVFALGRAGRSDSDPSGILRVGMEELLKTADVVSLHCPLTPETNRIIDASRLALMKPTSYLINTSRGQLIDEAALAAVLNSNGIAGAALDVLAEEPPRNGSPLIGARNCVITPHQAWAARAARERLLDIAVGNIEAFLRGEAINRVDALVH